TLIDCKFLKNFNSVLLATGDKALCLSVAKKEDYEAFRRFRQPSFFPLHSAFTCVVLRGGEL
ncbi:hypothetical protein KVP70_32165, partial [Duganella sp. HSC-15S17]